MQVLKSHKCFGGVVRFCEHESRETKSKMKFSTFVPEGELRGCLIWLSGLTCTDENFMIKAGAQRLLAEHKMMLVCPDTSPRGLNLPGDHDTMEFGEGAGFYVDATVPGYRDHYRMYSYINDELYSWIETKYGLKNKIAISGHSMGGHGALTIGLRNPQKYTSISALAPMVHPTLSDWGKKALEGYLGSDTSQWRKYDACLLVADGLCHPQKIIIDQGTEDQFLKKHILLDEFDAACKKAGQKVEINFREGYDHSYYFVATFIAEHIAFHAGFFPTK